MNSIERKMAIASIGFGLSAGSLVAYYATGILIMVNLSCIPFTLCTLCLIRNMLKQNGIEKDIEELKQELGLGELETEKGKSR